MRVSRHPGLLCAHIGLAVIASGSFLQPCYGAKVKSQAGPGAEFTRYKTYRWVPPKVLTKSGVVENDPVYGPAVKTAVNAQLTQLGMTEVADGGDLEVSTLVLTEKNPQLEAVMMAGPDDFMFGTPVATMGRYNREGTLVVNLIDTRTKKSAWVGLVRETIATNDGAGLKKLPSAAEKLFKKYPSTSK